MRLWITVAAVAVAGAIALAQDRSLQPTVRGQLAVGIAHRFDVWGKPGDVIYASVDIQRAGDGLTTVTLIDASGAALKEVPIWGRTNGLQAMAFVIPDRGVHRLSIVSDSAASYTIRTERKSPRDAAARATAAAPTIDDSPRIVRLEKDVQDDPAAVDRFWMEVRHQGGPLVEPIDKNEQEVLVTLLWKQTYETHNVLVLWPGRFSDDHYMRHVARTNVWYRTLRLVRGSRFSYRLAPNDGGAPHLTAQIDPLNPRSAIARNSSILETPGAPDESWFRRTPPARGTITAHRFESAVLKGVRDISVYTPPRYSPSSGPYALLIFFDLPSYTKTPPARDADLDDWARNGAPTTLDNLIGDHRINPTVACFVGYTPDSARMRDLLSGDYPAAIATELVPWLRASYAVSTDPHDVVIGGFSAAGGAAGAIALRYPSIFGNVLLQSGGGPRLTPLILESAKVPIRFHYDQGLYEFAGAQSQTFRPGELPFRESIIPDVAFARRLRDLLQARGYDVTYRETGGAHEDIHFRATLAEGLITLLETRH